MREQGRSRPCLNYVNQPGAVYEDETGALWVSAKGGNDACSRTCPFEKHAIDEWCPLSHVSKRRVASGGVSA